MRGKERILKALAGEATDSLPLMPITMMFAGDTAGIRYAEYARDHRKMVEAQLRVAEKYDIDYVSVISDPAREASDLGATVEWFDDQPPAIVESRALLDEKAKLKGLRPPDLTAPGRMRDRIEGVRLFKQRVGEEKLIEGWVEGPCAQAADLRGLNTLMLDFSDDPDFVEELFEFIVGMELAFAKAQVEAGADLIGIGDAASSLVGPRLYEKHVFGFEQRMVRGIQSMGAKVRLHICGNTRKILRWMGECGADMVDLDFLSPVSEGRAAMGPEQVIAGNIDPVRALRDGTPDSVTAAIAECHAQAGARYIVAAGCEIPRGTPEANLRAMTEYARNH